MVNIDTVYQTVLALANKEQRGYITPQEFNLFANHAQMEIFEQYFYDKGEINRNPGNQTDYSDSTKILAEKIQVFKRGPISLTQSGTTHLYPDPLGANPVWRLGNVFHGGTPELAEEITELSEIPMGGPLINPTHQNPIFRRVANGLSLFPTIASCRIFYITSPARVNWSYIVLDGKALFNSSAGTTAHFQLHASEEIELVYKILRLAGVAMQREDVTKLAAAMETAQIQQEKQTR